MKAAPEFLSTITYADMKTALLDGKLPLRNPSNWALSFGLFERVMPLPLASVAVSVSGFCERFPSEAPLSHSSRQLPSGPTYKRWHENMVTLHQLMGRGGDDWRDLLCIGYRLEETGAWAGNLSDIRPSLKLAGLSTLPPREVVRDLALVANQTLEGRERVRFRAACKALDLLRKHDVVRAAGLLPAEPIGTLPKLAKSGTFLAEFPPGLQVFETRPAEVRDVIRTVYSTALKLGLVSKNDVSPVELLDAITQDDRVFNDLATRMKPSSISIYRQRTVRHLRELDPRPKETDMSWEAMRVALRHILCNEAWPIIERFGHLRAAAKKAGLRPRDVTTGFVADLMDTSPQPDRAPIRGGARMLNELFDLGEEVAIFRPDAPIDMAALPGNTRVVRTRRLSEFLRHKA